MKLKYIIYNIINWLKPWGDTDRVYRHNCPVLKALERRVKRLCKHPAPLSGIVLISKDMMELTEIHNPLYDVTCAFEQG